ncbi:hypothetical protein HBI56_135140 [Parastagonospora nodorum]|uniref:Uncharacterized protein n=1 Tax=Phaeosphaeria nodorum (strain SN15 / ATCC MYA-4574 / FGSC 10173) TaxID=321614 RepID=A0A7U2F6Y8_PHANO|nr:hypothetical protein HBH56_038240 [Parastagonospora nodorum]QRC99879.1 hypothetical protein JI435_068110 [Parastagonospora nodorum SN15]KAH3934011.1 hypothetical protein HBH54_061220 [Parastagonospora nodorum]KAH3952496.1 hypothetical protein HBH53_048890 [Parastagonospora nodorum]KAH3979789.1 hypothetical protein HBH51_059900 [Parastagonospora nodorum]
MQHAGVSNANQPRGPRPPKVCPLARKISFDNLKSTSVCHFCHIVSPPLQYPLIDEGTQSGDAPAVR